MEKSSAIDELQTQLLINVESVHQLNNQVTDHRSFATSVEFIYESTIIIIIIIIICSFIKM